MKLRLIIFGLILSVSSSYGQTNNDCKQILKKEISLNDLQENIDQVGVDFQTLIFCDFDSIDYHIFMGPKGNMPLFAHFIIAFELDPKKKEEKFTFNDLKKILVVFKQSEEYSQVRKIVEAKNEIIQRVAIVENWNIDKELLVKTGFPEIYLEDIHEIVKENESTTYSNIFKIFSDTLKKRQERQAVEKESQDSIFKIQNPGLEKLIDWLYVYKDYKIGLKNSKELNRPLLLYFNGFGCVNSRRIESEILSKIEIKEYINNNLIFTSLIVDDQTKLNENEVYFSETLDKEVKYLGQINLELEMKIFNSDWQPLFVLIDLNGKEISRIGYTNDFEEFKLFLQTVEK